MRVKQYANGRSEYIFDKKAMCGSCGCGEGMHMMAKMADSFSISDKPKHCLCGKCKGFEPTSKPSKGKR